MLLIKRSIYGCNVIVLSWLKTVEDSSSKTTDVKSNYLIRPGFRLEGRWKNKFSNSYLLRNCDFS